MTKGPARLTRLVSELLLRPRTILVPLLNVGVASEIVNFAAALITGPDKIPPPGARIIVAGVVKVPEGQPLSEGRTLARSYRAMFSFLPPKADPYSPDGAEPDDATQMVAEPGVQVHRIVKVAYSVAQGIREAVLEENADLLLLHWKGYGNGRSDTVFGKVNTELLADPPCNTLLYRPGKLDNMQRILLPVRGGPSAELALAAGAALAARCQAEITLLHATPAARLLDQTPGRAVNGPDSQRLRGDEPYLELAARAAEVAGRYKLSIAPALTASSEVGEAISLEAGRHELVVMGAPADKKGEGSPVLRSLVAEKGKALLLVRSPEELNLKKYQRNVKPVATAGQMAVEHWFVENTYHGDEVSNLDAWLALKASRGLHLSVVLPTHNDEHRLFPLLTGLRKALQEHAPIADEILVVDAASTDETPQIAANMGFPVLRAGRTPLLPGALPEPLELLREALNLARGNVLVWLDPKAGKLHPSFVPALTPPLISDPGVLLVKPFWSFQATGHIPSADAEPVSIAQFSPLQPVDLLDKGVDELARLPLHTWFRAFFPALGAVVDPTSRVFAARATLLYDLLDELQRPRERSGAALATNQVTSNLSFYTGMLLQTAVRYGPRAIAQVEMQRRRNIRSSAKMVAEEMLQLRVVAELLAIFAQYPDQVTDPGTLDKIRYQIEAAIF